LKCSLVHDGLKHVRLAKTNDGFAGGYRFDGIAASNHHMLALLEHEVFGVWPFDRRRLARPPKRLHGFRIGLAVAPPKFVVLVNFGLQLGPAALHSVQEAFLRI